jgi:hypothetical protein
MSFFFFKRPKPRQFNYKPLYYDPDKEEAEERKRTRNALQGNDPKERMRAEIRRRWKTDRTPPDNRNNIIRILIYVIFSFFALYLIFFTDFVNKLVSLFVR